LSEEVNTNTQTDNHEYNLPFNLNELKATLRNCKSKSPGPDDIPYMFIKKLSEKALNTLLNI
jgi:hypothetical protein